MNLIIDDHLISHLNHFEQTKMKIYNVLDIYSLKKNVARISQDSSGRFETH